MAAPGWYPDPSGAPGRSRFWDGRAWTGHTAPAAAPAVIPPPPPPRTPSPASPYGSYGQGGTGWGAVPPTRASRPGPPSRGPGRTVAAVVAAVVVLLLVAAGVFAGVRAVAGASDRGDGRPTITILPLTTAPGPR